MQLKLSILQRCILILVIYSLDITFSVSGEELCQCPSDPCDPMLAPWCVKKWPHLYREATCVPTGCCEALWYATSHKEQLLECPDPVCPTPTGPGLCAELCSKCEDQGQICCSNGCGHQCMTPVEPTCPPGTAQARCAGDPCETNPPDSKCLENFPDLTCVANYCGGCFANYYESSSLQIPLQCPQDCKEGDKICPDFSIVVRDPYNRCQFPSCPPGGCETGGKECYDGSVVTRDPNNDCLFSPCPVVIGCPLVPQYGLLCEYPPAPNDCSNDVDCTNEEEKCCPVHCDRLECIKSASKPGICPAVESIEALRNCGNRERRRICGVDSDCGARMKCCPTNCEGTACVEPVSEPPTPEPEPLPKVPKKKKPKKKTKSKSCYPKGTNAKFAKGKCQCKAKKKCKGKYQMCKKAGKMCKKGEVCCCPKKSWDKKKCGK